MRGWVLLALLAACFAATCCAALTETPCDACVAQATACFGACSSKECGDGCMERWVACSTASCRSDEPAAPLWAQWNGNAQHNGRRDTQLPHIDNSRAGQTVANVSLGEDVCMSSGGAFSESRELLFWGASDQRLRALSSKDLSIAWSIQMGGSVGAPAIGLDGNLYFSSSDGSMYAAGQDGGILWKFISDKPSFNRALSDPVIDGQGNVYAGDLGGNVYSWEASGELRWGVELPGRPRIENAGAITRNGLFVVRGRTAVVAVRAEDGSTVWQQEVDGVGMGVSVGGSDEELVCVVGHAASALNATTGEHVWSLLPERDGSPHQLFGRCAFSADGSSIFLAAASHPEVYAASSKDGRVLWRQTVSQVPNIWPSMSSPSVGADGYVYVITNNGFAYAMDGATGSIRWGKLLGDYPLKGYSQSSALVSADGTVFMSLASGAFISLLP